jgi:hypothetical protein
MIIYNIKERHQLVSLKVIKIDADLYSFSTDDGRNFTVHGDVEYLAYFLQKIQAKESISSPKSLRLMTYAEMARRIDSQGSDMIYCWWHVLKNKIIAKSFTKEKE